MLAPGSLFICSFIIFPFLDMVSMRSCSSCNFLLIYRGGVDSVLALLLCYRRYTVNDPRLRLTTSHSRPFHYLGVCVCVSVSLSFVHLPLVLEHRCLSLCSSPSLWRAAVNYRWSIATARESLINLPFLFFVIEREKHRHQHNNLVTSRMLIINYFILCVSCCVWIHFHSVFGDVLIIFLFY